MWGLAIRSRLLGILNEVIAEESDNESCSFLALRFKTFLAVACFLKSSRLPSPIQEGGEKKETVRILAGGYKLMDGNTGRDWRAAALLGSLLAIGLILGGWVMGAQIKAIRLGDRYVTVKGLVERRVKSDLAIWPLSFKEAGDDLSLVYGKTETDRKAVLDFLQQQGLQPSEIEIGIIRVVDTQANEYGGGTRAPQRYIVEQTITVRTSRVDQVAAVAQRTILLLQKGIVLGGNPGQSLTYKFNGLNSIKPDMITEATRNARAAADRFASDSGSKVGAIRQANQGVFSILSAEQGGDASETGEAGGEAYGSDASLMKTVRVVTTVQYYLEK
jgi:hypothetical protein